jgi:hypothetical protein
MSSDSSDQWTSRRCRCPWSDTGRCPSSRSHFAQSLEPLPIGLSSSSPIGRLHSPRPLSSRIRWTCRVVPGGLTRGFPGLPYCWSLIQSRYYAHNYQNLGISRERLCDRSLRPGAGRERSRAFTHLQRPCRLHLAYGQSPHRILSILPWYV